VVRDFAHGPSHRRAHRSSGGCRRSIGVGAERRRRSPEDRDGTHSADASGACTGGSADTSCGIDPDRLHDNGDHRDRVGHSGGGRCSTTSQSDAYAGNVADSTLDSTGSYNANVTVTITVPAAFTVGRYAARATRVTRRS
jgi:hypothetical protein